MSSLSKRNNVSLDLAPGDIVTSISAMICYKNHFFNHDTREVGLVDRGDLLFIIAIDDWRVQDAVRVEALVVTSYGAIGFVDAKNLRLCNNKT